MKPTAADIAIVIGKIEAGDWLDPSEEPISWSCVLYDPDGVRAGDGDAHTAREAMALAWSTHMLPNAKPVAVDKRVEEVTALRRLRRPRSPLA